MNFNCIKTILIAATAMVSLNSFSQDLIARQAPIDRKLKSVDSLALQKQIRAEQSAYPGLSLYPTWNNEYVQAYGDAIVPESYKVDLTGFCMPTTHTKITDVFGYRPRRRRMHYGLDVKVFIGDTIRAAFDGKVRVVKNQGRRGYGKYIVIRHDNGLETVYGHLSKQIVEINQLVKAGEPIALGGFVSPSAVVSTSSLSGISSAVGPTSKLPCTVGVTRIPFPILDGSWKTVEFTRLPQFLSIRRYSPLLGTIRILSSQIMLWISSA